MKLTMKVKVKTMTNCNRHRTCTLDRMRRMTVKAATDHTEVKWLSLSVMRMMMTAIPACSAAVRSAATASARQKKTQAYKANISHIPKHLVKTLTDQLTN